MNQKEPNFERNLLLHLIRLVEMGQAFAREDKLDTKDFRKPWMQSIWGAAKDHHKKYQEWPAAPLLMMVINQLYDGVNLTETERPLVDEFFMDCLQGTTPLNPIYYGTECERFIEERRAAKVFAAGQRGELSVDDAISRLTEIRSLVRSHHTASVDPFESLLFQECGRVIKTGLDDLDFRLPGGGPMGGTTTLLIGFTSSGKSTVLRTIEAGVALRKQRVLTVTLEDSVRQVAAKLYSNLAGIPATLLYNKDFRTEEMVNRIKECQEAMRGYIRIIDPFDNSQTATSAQGVTIEDIDAMVEREINKGFIPDVVTIDYLNRIRNKERGNNRVKDEAQAMRQISEDMKDRLAKKYQIPVITCGQANGEGFDKAVLQIVDMARSKEAAWAFDVIGTLGSPRKLEEHFNKEGNGLGSEDEEMEAVQEAQRFSPEDLKAGRCPLKLVHFNLAKVRDGMTGHFPLYADFCYGRFAAPGTSVNTIKGMMNVDEIREQQIKENKEK